MAFQVTGFRKCHDCILAIRDGVRMAVGTSGFRSFPFRRRNRLAARVAVAAFLFSMLACSGLSPNIRNGRTDLLRAVGREGEMVIYLNVGRSAELIGALAGSPQPGLSDRVYDAIVVASEDWVCGAIEGDIPMVGKSVVANSLKGHPATAGDMKCYVSSFNGEKLYFDLVSPGVILFSTSEDGFLHAFDIFIENRENVMAESVSLLLQSASIGIYGMKPRTSASKMFEDGHVDAVMLLLCHSETEGEYLMSGILKMKDKDAFRIVNAFMSDSYIRDLKAKGSKIDMRKMLETCRPSIADDFVGYYDFPAATSLILGMSGR